MELESTRREIQATQAKHEALVSLRDQKTKCSGGRELDEDQARARPGALHFADKSLEQTDAEAKKLDALAKQLNEAEQLLQNLQIVTLERQKVEEQMNSICP